MRFLSIPRILSTSTGRTLPLVSSVRSGVQEMATETKLQISTTNPGHYLHSQRDGDSIRYLHQDRLSDVHRERSK